MLICAVLAVVALAVLFSTPRADTGFALSKAAIDEMTSHPKERSERQP
jgi:hypothetical protein